MGTRHSRSLLLRMTAAPTTGDCSRASAPPPTPRDARAALDRDQAVNLDVRATDLYLRDAWELTHGTIDPEDVNPQ
jgi:hypothetical protein